MQLSFAGNTSCWTRMFIGLRLTSVNLAVGKAAPSRSLRCSRRIHNDSQPEEPAVGPSSSDSHTSETTQASLKEPNDVVPKKRMTIAEQDAALLNAWKEREGSLANAQFEGGKVEEGYRRDVKANIFRYI